MVKAQNPCEVARCNKKGLSCKTIRSLSLLHACVVTRLAPNEVLLKGTRGGFETEEICEISGGDELLSKLEYYLFSGLPEKTSDSLGVATQRKSFLPNRKLLHFNLNASVESAAALFYFIFVFNSKLIFFRWKIEIALLRIKGHCFDINNGLVLVILMAEICCRVVSKEEATIPYEPSSRAARRRRMEIRRIKMVDVASSEADNSRKRKKMQVYATSFFLDCENAKGNSASDEERENRTVKPKNGRSETNGTIVKSHSSSSLLIPVTVSDFHPKFGVASVCGRRRDMEDAVAIHPSFHHQGQDSAASSFHYFSVFDGHGCSHVAIRCRERLHELVKEELGDEKEWKGAMERSFTRMDKEVIKWNESMEGANCRCELQSPECDAVGSTAVVAIVTPDKVVVANCGDSRAVLCRNGKPVPLSSDHKPDRPDELNRIQEAGGRVIFWDGPRVLGVLAMSRAIGDNYLKPYVSCEPEVTVTDRTAEDELLILASDGLWDVVSNDTACGVARMCLRGGKCDLNALLLSPEGEAVGEPRMGGEISDKACADASMLLTKLALARHSTDNVSVVVVDLRRAT
ncbi:hypothetical protein V6N13_145268 [Hibiscus sabdariffa]